MTLLKFKMFILEKKQPTPFHNVIYITIAREENIIIHYQEIYIFDTNDVIKIQRQKMQKC